MKGSVWGPLKCSVTMDFIGKDCENTFNKNLIDSKEQNKSKSLLKYKEMVPIPPLG